jgi:phage gp36-like protein
MAYATTEDLQLRLAPQLRYMLADDNADGQDDTAAMQAMLDDAAAQIDHALAGRYETPIVGPTDLLRRWCVDLAVENLFLRRREALPAAHGDRADLTRKALSAIADGLATLSGATPRVIDYTTESLLRGVDPVFDAEVMEDF